MTMINEIDYSRNICKKKSPHVEIRKRFALVFVVFIIMIFLTTVYQVIAPLFEFQYRFKYAFLGSSLYLVVPILLIYSYFLYGQQRRDTLSDKFIIVLALTYFLPGHILYMFGSWSVGYYFFAQLSYLCLCVINEVMPHHMQLKVGGLPRLRLLHNSLYGVSFFIAISVILITLVYNDLSLNINLDDVYKMRDDWRNSNMPNIFNYYLPFASRICPVLLVISIKDKKVALSILLVLTQLLLFSFGGSKYALFAIILSVIIALSRFQLTSKGIIYLYTLFLLICSVECVFHIGDIPIFSIYTIRRLSFVPNQIAGYYYEFFENRDFLFYSESFLKSLLDYPYSVGFPHVIGDFAFGLPDMGANTGMFAEGYSQVGWFAIPIYSFLYIIAFRAYESCSKGFIGTKYYQAPVLGVILYTLSFQDGSFFSVLLTQGFILTIVTMYLLSKRFEERKYATA